MSVEEINAEIAHWTRWLDDHDLIAKAPSPGSGLSAVGKAIGLAGSGFTVLGLIKVLGDIATTGGIVTMIGGYVVSKRSKQIVRDIVSAEQLVAMRLDELLYYAMH